MRNVIIIIFCLLICCQPASAGLEIVNSLAEIVDMGITQFLLGISDSLYEQTYDPGYSDYDAPETYGELIIERSKKEPKETEVYIYAIVSKTTNPFECDEINEFRVLPFLLLSTFCVINSIIGLIYVACSLLSDSAADVIDSVLDRSSSFRNARIKEHFSTLIIMVVIIMFTDAGIQVLFVLSELVTAMFLRNEFESQLLSPSKDNPVLYLLIAIFYWGLDKIFDARELLVFMFAMASYLIGILVVFKPTKELGISITYYLTGVLFLQPIIIIVATMGFIGVEIICSVRGIIPGSPAEFSIYLALILILFFLAIAFIVGLAFMKKTANKSIRLVI